MAIKSKTQEKIIIKQFKDGSSHWFVNYAHYTLLENGEIQWCAGETDKEELRGALKAYVKRNKKSFVARPKSEVKEYNEIIPIGEYKGKTVSQVLFENKKFLIWMLEKYSFKSGEEKLKQEIIEILK